METGSVVSPELLGAPAPRSLVIPLDLFPGVVWSGWEGVVVIHESELLGSRKLKQKLSGEKKITLIPTTFLMELLFSSTHAITKS